jgi:hypothetical protein
MVRRRLPGKARSLAIVGAAAFVVASGGAFAMTQADRFLDSAGRYHGCVAKSGAVRVVRHGVGCRAKETAIAWSQTGPPGRSVSYVNGYSEHVLVQPGSFRFVNAVCPTGTLVVGGGYATERIAPAKLAASNSYPIRMPDGRGAWYVVMQNVGPEAEEFWAIAYCARFE